MAVTVTVAEKVLKLLNSSGHVVRLGYDGDNYLAVQVDSGGDATISLSTGSKVTIGHMLDLSGIGAGSANLKITATTDTPSDDPTTDAPTGWMEIDVGGSPRYIPFYS